AMSGPAERRATRGVRLRGEVVLCRRARLIGRARHDLGISACLVQAPQRRPACGLMHPQYRGVAAGAEPVGGPVPTRERARRIGAASDKHTAPSCSALEYLTDFVT